MAGIELTENAQPFVQRALDRGLVINATHGNVLRLLPPYIVEQEQIDDACATLQEILA